eukprot:2174143-Ditylum_brightwellii.AAC.1
MRLRGKTDERLKQLPELEDKSKEAVMRILSVVLSCCYLTRQDLLPLVIFHMVRCSLKYGISHISPIAFAMYGFMLNITGDFKEGY